MNLNIVVFFGGRSYEHDVSIITGLQVLQNLNKFKYNIFPVYIGKNGRWNYGEGLKKIETYLNFKESKFSEVCVFGGKRSLYVYKRNKLKELCRIDCAVLATHGGEGEDGTLSAILEANCIPKTCPGVLESALAMAKILTKRVLSANKIPTIKSFEKDNKIEFPVVVKPNKLGSSIGISFCNNKEELENGVLLSENMGEVALIEKALTDFFEFNIACFKKGGKIELSEIEKPNKSGAILSFENKYLSASKGGAGMQTLEREFPAKIEHKLKNEIEKMAIKTFKAFNLSGVCRIDFMFDNIEKKLYVNEINTIPGSLAFYLFKNSYSFTALLDELILTARADERAKKRDLIFSSDILDKFCISHGAKNKLAN